MCIGIFIDLNKTNIFSIVIVPLICIPIFLKELREKNIDNSKKIIIITFSIIFNMIIIFLINSKENSKLFENILFPAGVLFTFLFIFLKSYFKKNFILLLIPFLWGLIIFLKFKGRI